ncbi:hypothetical protein KIW84_045133 [Lathyrus oleraceus]|uniref:Uncharacterized protein n=1 Tax=Pisum sativum TaxID=3888 RepID=A0A9D4XN24_PEA|nr:hypothetical protein KIW84_045133 [Pisum sativum]
MQIQELNESQAARVALESLESDVKQASNLVEEYRNSGRFYLLMKCRYIVKEVEQVIRDIRRSLAALSLANTEVISRISDQVNRLQSGMQRAEFEASQSQHDIFDKLNHGIKEPNLDQAFVNDMLEEMARPVGVLVEPSEISKEIASIRWEKEEAANRKEIAEVIFLEQIILLLSQANTTSDFEEVKKQYFQRVQVIERYGSREKYIPPLNSFRCSITKVVMVDRVSLCTGELTNIIISILGNSDSIDVKMKILIILKGVVQGHARNKEKVVESQGWQYIISCLHNESRVIKEAVDLLYELLQDCSGWNKSFCKTLYEHPSTVNYLITILNGPVSDSIETAEKILTELFETDEENICLLLRLAGSKSSRMSMAKAIINFNLEESNLKLLGEKGIIPPLLEMLSGSIESKELSLSALVKLAGVHANKGIIAAYGGVPIILDLMFSLRTRAFISIKCFEILEKLSSSDGIGLVKKAVLAAHGVSLILPLLDYSDSEIRETTITLLFLFSQLEPEGVVEYLFRPRRLEALVGFLENDKNNDVQVAATGLLANLPKSERKLTMQLIELGGLDAIINILKNGTMEAKENALNALFRFTDPTDIKLQRDLVRRGIYPLLVKFFNTGSMTAKARAIAFIGDLSMSTPKLTVVSKSSFFRCYRSSQAPLCSAHGSVCNMNSIFCLLEANTLPGLIKLLQEEVHATAYEAIQTLSTLVIKDFPQRGACVLHESNAMRPILKILNWGNDSLKAEGLGLLEKVFVSKEMVESYGSMARLRLFHLTGMNVYGDGHLRRKVARVLSLLERYSRSSSHSITGVMLSENLRL